jgi:hypothetical protein
MEQQKASEVLDAFQRYTQAFQALDARAVAGIFMSLLSSSRQRRFAHCRRPLPSSKRTHR